MDFNFFNILDDVRLFDGKVAIVALPCHIKIIRKIMETDEVLKSKIHVLIGLFCGHVSKPELVNMVLRKNKIDILNIKNFKFIVGHWRGRSHVLYKDEKESSFNFKKFSIFQNLFFCSADKCLHCNDHTAELADISLGDIWTLEMKKKKIKQNALIVRKTIFEEYLNKLKERNILSLDVMDDMKIFKAQKRSLIYHKHIKARGIVARLFGQKVKSANSEYNVARWNDLLSAFFIIINLKISNKKWFKRLIVLLPDFVWKPYLYLMKIMINF